MSIIANGIFSDKVRKILVDRTNSSAREISLGAQHIFISDYFSPDFYGECISSISLKEAYICCCFSEKGLFVSSVLRSNGPCYLCLEKFWFANVRYWKHQLELEKLLVEIGGLLPDVRYVHGTNNLVKIAYEIIMGLENGSNKTELCTYFDVKTCRTSYGLLIPLTNCNCSHNVNDSQESEFKVMLDSL